MLHFKKQSDAKALIIFIHGFIGGMETWERKDDKKSIYGHLSEDTEFSKSFDYAIFNYFTKIIDYFDGKIAFWGLVIPVRGKFRRNLNIENISDILHSEISTRCKKYDRIILIAHSMGGLISKSAILKLIAKNDNSIIPSLYISLAVPHDGSNIAVFAKAIINNPQIRDLAPLSPIIHKLNQEWLDTKDRLPRTVYFSGYSDDVVLIEGSQAYEARNNNFERWYSDDDHFTIITPENSSTMILDSIKDECLSILLAPKKPTSKIYPQGQMISLDAFIEYRDGQLKKNNNKLKQLVSSEISNKIPFPRETKRIDDNSIHPFSSLFGEIETSDSILIYGIGGVGKSIAIKRMINDILDNAQISIIIYCDAKNWDNIYSNGLESNISDERISNLLNGFASNITFRDIENLKITKDTNILKILFVDGLSEIPSDSIRKQITGVLKLIQREFGFKIVVATRFFDSTEYKSFKIFKLKKIGIEDLRTILQDKFGKSTDKYSKQNLEYLSIPFFLDIAITTGHDEITEYSNYINEHVFKNVAIQHRQSYLEDLSKLAFNAYHSEKKFLIQGPITGQIKKYITSKILHNFETGFKFDHHLINEFLVAYQIANNEEYWTAEKFDKITFEDKKSFVVIQMVLEQITDKQKGDAFLTNVYDWNFYAVLHCLRTVKNGFTIEFARVIILLLSEKLFDRFTHTRNNTLKKLKDLIIEVNILGIDFDLISKIPLLNENEKRELFKDFIIKNKKYFVDSKYFRWYDLFSSSEEAPSVEFIANIVSDDPLIGWSSANVLKRRILSETSESNLQLLFLTTNNPAVKWRIVHALGASNSKETIEFLCKIIEKNELLWVTYGALRSILEIALFYQEKISCDKILRCIFDLVNNQKYDKAIIHEMIECLSDAVLSEKYEIVLNIFDLIISSEHENFLEKEMIDEAKKHFNELNNHGNY